MHPALQKLFELHAAGSFDKQMFLAELIGEQVGAFDPASGTLRFGDQYQWPVQVLGMASVRTGFWRWAWAEKEGSMPPELTKVTRAMRRLGEAHQIPELMHPQVPRGESMGTILALTASGVFKANAFYRLGTPRAAVFLLIGGSDYPQNDVTPAIRIPTVIPQVLQRFPMNHRRALMGYLRHYGLTAEPDGSDVIVQNGAGPVLLARFDGLDRLTGLDFPPEV